MSITLSPSKSAYLARVTEGRRDQFGRIIPNLYPLELAVYDNYGELVPMAPPSLGLPTVDRVGDRPDAETVPTTITPGR